MDGSVRWFFNYSYRNLLSCSTNRPTPFTERLMRTNSGMIFRGGANKFTIQPSSSAEGKATRTGQWISSRDICPGVGLSASRISSMSWIDSVSSAPSIWDIPSLGLKLSAGLGQRIVLFCERASSNCDEVPPSPLEVAIRTALLNPDVISFRSSKENRFTFSFGARLDTTSPS